MYKERDTAAERERERERERGREGNGERECWSRVGELPSSIKVTEALTHRVVPRSLSTNCAGK